MLSITFLQNDAVDHFVNAHNRLAFPEFGPFSILKNTHVVLKLWRIFGFKDRRTILSKTTTFDFCIGYNSLTFFNTLRPRQNGRHFPDDILKWIFLNKNVWISIEIPLKFVPKGQINNIRALVQIMAWRCPGDKPLSEPMMVSLLTHMCVTRPQWVKTCPTQCTVHVYLPWVSCQIAFWCPNSFILILWVIGTDVTEKDTKTWFDMITKI